MVDRAANRMDNPATDRAVASGRALAAAIGALESGGFVPALLAWLQAVAAPDSVICLGFGPDGPPVVLFRQAQDARVFARLEAAYLGGAYLLDPFHTLHLGRAATGVYQLRDVAPDAFARSRYHEEYYRDTTLLDEIVFLARPVGDVTVMLCLGRDAASGRAFDAADSAACRAAAPVVVALAERHWRGGGEMRSLHGAGGEDAGDVAGGLMASALRRGIRLSRRQAEVALLILRGHSTPSIGLALGVSPQTVKVFRRQLYARCGLSSQAELFALMLPLLAAPASASPVRVDSP